MEPELLSVGEFVRWKTDHDHKIDRILIGVDKLVEVTSEHETRLALLEQTIDAHHARTTKTSGVISAAVSALTTAVLAFFAHKVNL